MKKLKVGDLVYLKDVGFPFNKTDDGESWEGASCRVTNIQAGVDGRYIEVEPIIPIKTDRGIMTTCLFDSTQVRLEDRPWLRKRLRDILALREKLLEVAEFAGTLR